jgi:hypothetical protein
MNVDNTTVSSGGLAPAAVRAAAGEGAVCAKIDAGTSAAAVTSAGQREVFQ